MSIYRGDGAPTAGTEAYDQADLDAAVAAAAASETAAATSETNAAASAAAASTSESNAAASETNAAASASAAATSASNAATSETNAAASEAAAAASYDSFDDRYLGAKASDPTLDNDGNALLTGALYWNTTTSTLRVYNSASWEQVPLLPALAGNANKFLQVNSGATDEQWFDLFGSANTWSAAQTIQDAYPASRIRDTSTGVTVGGLWGINVSAGNLSLRVNTAAGGDFSSAASPLVVAYDAATLTLSASHAVFGNRAVQVNNGLSTLDSSVTLALSHMGSDLLHFSASPHTWTIPPNSSVAFPVGTRMMITNNAGAGTITLARGTGVALYARGTNSIGDANKTIAAGTVCWLLQYATNAWAVLNTGGIT